MACDEMETIRDLDVPLLFANTHRLRLYFAERDDWVGEQRELIMQVLDQDKGSLRIVHGDRDIPHAFCISETL